jgi:hypothetical protein
MTLISNQMINQHYMAAKAHAVILFLELQELVAY